MKNFILFILTLLAINVCGQDYLIDKRGGSYYYQGKEYKCKQLGIVYIEYEEAFNIYHSGKRNFNTAKYLAIGGIVSIGVGFMVMLNSKNVYGLVYGGITVLTGMLVESVALFYLIKGDIKTSKARKKFNFEMLERHGYNSEVSLVFGGTKNGFGLIVQF